MDETIVHALLEINRRFYQDYAEPFAATRRRIQDGVRQAVSNLPDGRYLDLGCGSGALADFWTRPRPDGTIRQGLYLGVDFSAGLLAEARQNLPEKRPADLGINFSAARFDGTRTGIPVSKVFHSTAYWLLPYCITCPAMPTRSTFFQKCGH